MRPLGGSRIAASEVTADELMQQNRKAEIDANYEAYHRHPLDEPDEWGDLASFLDANLLHKRTIPQEEEFRAT